MAQSKKPKQKKRTGPKLWLQNALIRVLLGALLALPYRTRVRTTGWIVAHIVAPIAGYRKRVRGNLNYIFPDMDPAEIKRLEVGVADNVGRTLIEIYSGESFISRVRDVPLQGPGAALLEQCHRENRPVILVTGHFGNYDVPRAALIAKGYRVGALYNPMHNGYFNTHYENAISTIGKPIFPRGRKGLAELLKFVRGGGMTGFLVDLHFRDGVVLQHFGKPARTALSAAELALKYNAPLVPIYGIRRENGLDFDIVVEDPIPASDPETMTQGLLDSVEAITREHMEQWFWVHRRWKVENPKVK